MKVVVAVDSFKGSLSSRQIGEIFAREASVFNACQVIPVEIADGGEGTLDALVASGKFEERQIRCLNPLFEEIDTTYGVHGDCAFVEMAKSGGLTLIPYKEGNALYTTTYGTGQCIADAVVHGAKTVFVSVGGSATNDGGIGALNALGYKFLSADGDELKPIGANLGKIASIDDSFVSSRYKDVRFVVLTDVDNPLVGPLGATMFYGGQKGAVGNALDVLEDGMKNYSRVVAKHTGIVLDNLKGAGGAGGLSGGLMAFLNAEIVSGIDSVLHLIDFENVLQGADAVITGEGKIDDQSAHGKAISGVCACAKKNNIPVYAIVGIADVSQSAQDELGLKHIYQISSLADSVENSIKYAQKYAQTMAKTILSAICKGE